MYSVLLKHMASGAESMERALHALLHEHLASLESSGEAPKGFKPGMTMSGLVKFHLWQMRWMGDTIDKETY
jgi:hypothetical protein